MDHAFAILAAEHRPMLLAYARALCYGDGHAAENVVQETLLVACRRLHEFRAENDGHFGRCLRGIARNKAVEAHRAAGRGRVVADSRIIEGLEDVFGRLTARLRAGGSRRRARRRFACSGPAPSVWSGANSTRSPQATCPRPSRSRSRRRPAGSRARPRVSTAAAMPATLTELIEMIEMTKL